MDKFGAIPSKTNIKKFIKEFDNDNNGKLDRNEFLMVIKNILKLLLDNNIMNELIS